MPPQLTTYCWSQNGCAMQIKAFLSVLDSTNSLVAAFANATAYIPDPAYVDSFTSATACPSGDSGAQVTSVPTSYTALNYDFALFSYVGCRCNAGYDNIYSVDSQGMTHQ